MMMISQRNSTIIYQVQRKDPKVNPRSEGDRKNPDQGLKTKNLEETNQFRELRVESQIRRHQMCLEMKRIRRRQK